MVLNQVHVLRADKEHKNGLMYKAYRHRPLAKLMKRFGLAAMALLIK